MTDRQDRPGPAPGVFRPDDPAVIAVETERERDAGSAFQDEAGGRPPATLDAAAAPFSVRPAPWLLWALAGLLGLFALALGVDAVLLVQELAGISIALAGLAAGLLLLAVGAMAGFAFRELRAIARLRRIDDIRAMAERALAGGDRGAADSALADLEALYGRRRELAWGCARFREHRADTVDAEDALVLFEHEVLKPLDRQASAAIGRTAQMTAVFTAISPFAAVDIMLTAWRNLALIREIASLYGGRPGLFGSVKLLRRVLLHLALTGGMEATDGLASEMLGGGMAAKLSTRLGEGLVNGLLTARVGIATMKYCRPLPWLQAPKPSIREMAGRIAGEVKARM
ncbi:MAG: TIGR01620 family protein [Alphaproteobacteria bacterium]|jgi:putative membrane protein|nr:TIGR01620 family protein [Alphaproteobacteria bacterium]